MKKNIVQMSAKQMESQLKFYGNNRSIKASHVATLVKNMIEDFANFPPIIVNKDTMEIVDGQHRLTAFLKLASTNPEFANKKYPVEFREFADEDEMKEYIMRMGKAVKPLNLYDRIKIHASSNPSYAKMYEFSKINPELLMNKGKTDNIATKPKYGYITYIMRGTKCSTELDKGTIEITDTDILKGHEIYYELKKIFECVGWSDDMFNHARIDWMSGKWHQCRKEHDFDSWCLMFKRNKKKFSVQIPFTPVMWNNWFDQALGIMADRKRRNVK